MTALGLLAAAAFAVPLAHPQGNVSVNTYHGFVFTPDQVTATVIVDSAEIPTLQEKPNVDAGYAARTCADAASGTALTVSGVPLQWTVTSSTFEYLPGASGLDTSRLTCALSAPATLDSPASVTVTNTYRTDRVGWREMTAVGNGVRLVDSPLPTGSVSAELREYPEDVLASVLDVRTATFRTEPGHDGGQGAAAAPSNGDWLGRTLAAAERQLQSLAGSGVTPALAILLALVLGAAHAALPGHGKTVMAAYLAGRRGRRRDAVAVGATVTIAHTGGVLVLGALLSTGAMFAGDTAIRYLALASGLLVIAVGVGMLFAALPSRRSRRDHGHAHGHGHSHSHSHDHDHGHHHHHHGSGWRGRLGIAGIGIAGGLVPSPSALVVLLASIGLGRTGFGILLVVCYGLGMAGTLTAAGLLLLRIQDRLADPARRPRFLAGPARLAARFAKATPAASAGLVLVVGCALAARAAAGFA